VRDHPTGVECRSFGGWPWLGLFAAIVGISPALADCGHPRVVVHATAEDRDNACSALTDVLNFFAKGGLVIEPELTIRFRREVYVELVNPITREATRVRVSGFYRESTKELQMTDSSSPWAGQRRPWGLAWDAQVSRSILQHEIVHAIVAQLMGGTYARLPRSWHEALAYAVQIDLMPDDLRHQVVSQYPREEGFATTLQINDVTYAMNPDAFAVAAYKIYVRDGRINFLKAAMALRLEIIDLENYLR